MIGARLRRGWAVATVAAVLCAGAAVVMPAQAWAESDAVKELAAPPPIQLPLKPSAEFAKFPRYAGMLGSRQIVLKLGPKSDDPAGVHGEYQYSDTGEVILIAGDRDGDTLEVEESNDGTHITGNWVGKFAADGSVAGDRMNVDDSDPQPFDLKPLAAEQPVPPPGAPASTASTASTAAAQPSAGAATAPASGGHAVGGVSNLQTGE
ncbi:Putative exported protein [Paraburkholderia xenovorans LB400]|uniref:Exported protein n=2 Tax=Paraburkholderia xenovorans TaxID=36873 RepID=Q13Z53_PARXL|nr:Putative exported protein [Paraburkholderia xenovorans LB400]